MTIAPENGLVQFFCRHLVGLCVAYRHIPDDDEKPERFSICSGTLILIHNVLCFLTAGHVLKELDELRSHPNVKIESSAFADTFGLGTVSDVPVPFDLVTADLFYIDDDEEGLDFGVIAINPHFARLLAKNGVVALAEEQWAHQHKVAFDRYALLGLPVELTPDRVTPGVGGSATPVMAFLTPTTADPNRKPRRHAQFVAKLDGPEPKDAKGMSGGPIFGFRIDPGPEVRYWVVALQSSWDPDSRTIYATPMPTLASLMTEWASAAIRAATT
ncbi:hypothetical protein [Mesorhizobium sp. B1-1-5]|uniref:hypothetical protein n=1 Tax=Mesorhizobium sp. B1-1-5 TaxID=2589979 RepID=UPI00112997E0|nr:hypothetical protein [Mesorhizobium sp. B1-1-5]TPO13754.1 hypothetical protein FJ980_00845 [Mesorhizobium sp. B1-1-5]